MKLKKVRTCSGCRGLYSSKGSAECTACWELKRIDTVETVIGDLGIYIPKGGYCYKPKTVAEYFESCKLNQARSLKEYHAV